MNRKRQTKRTLREPIAEVFPIVFDESVPPYRTRLEVRPMHCVPIKVPCYYVVDGRIVIHPDHKADMLAALDEVIKKQFYDSIKDRIAAELFRDIPADGMPL